MAKEKLKVRPARLRADQVAIREGNEVKVDFGKVKETKRRTREKREEETQ
jgi:hypothetical protein